MTAFSDIIQQTKDARIAIIGFGREGKATYRFFRKLFPDKHLCIMDSNTAITSDALLQNDIHITLHTGPDYLKHLKGFDMAVKTPGITLSALKSTGFEGIITSQTNLFLEVYAKQTIGITGTKGKSTTSCLLQHMLNTAGRKTVFAGNIGIPPFEVLDMIDEETLIVYEMSSHQLETVQSSPHMAVLLNIFQEHLDHYDSYTAYGEAKYNIARFQKPDDFFICNTGNEMIGTLLQKHPPLSKVLPFSSKELLEEGCYVDENAITINFNSRKHQYPSTLERNILGKHNLGNIGIAIMICKILGIDDSSILKSVASFKGLPHRLEYAGNINGKHFYNDSIATIPEAAIEAIKTLKKVGTLVTGGFDRGISYNDYIRFLSESDIKHIVFTGEAGERMYSLIKKLPHKALCSFFNSFDDAVVSAIKLTEAGEICLLSPAAASYNEFSSFEERGKRFCALIL